MTRIRFFAHTTLGMTSGISGIWEKYSRARRAFCPSREKSSSWGRDNSISFESHSRSYSGKNLFSMVNVKRVRPKSRFIHSAKAGCWTFTATLCPVSLTIAKWTCASDAAPIGSWSNSEKWSDNGWPVSFMNISSMDSNDDTGHLSCRGIKVVVHSSGRR